MCETCLFKKSSGKWKWILVGWDGKEHTERLCEEWEGPPIFAFWSPHQYLAEDGSTKSCWCMRLMNFLLILLLCRVMSSWPSTLIFAGVPCTLEFIIISGEIPWNFKLFYLNWWGGGRGKMDVMESVHKGVCFTKIFYIVYIITTRWET